MLTKEHRIILLFNIFEIFHIRYPFDLSSYECRFSTDRVKESINVNDYFMCLLIDWQPK